MSAYFKTVIKSILVFLFWPALHAICRRFVPKENFFRLLYLSVNILDFQEVLDRRHAIIIEKYNFFNLLRVTLLTLFLERGANQSFSKLENRTFFRYIPTDLWVSCDTFPSYILSMHPVPTWKLSETLTRVERRREFCSGKFGSFAFGNKILETLKLAYDLPLIVL